MTNQEREKRIAKVEREWADDLNDVSFDEITYGSKTKRWWRCEKCGWEWKASPNNRIQGGTGCPMCAGKVLTPENSLAGVRPDLISWWDHERNGAVKPQDVFANTHKRYYFVCPHGHSYKRAVYHMTMTGGCKYCAGQTATPENNLAITNPDLAAEWHPTRNGDKKPEDYLSGSNAIVWWRCSRGHTWKASIAKRALRGDRCPQCHTRVSLVQVRVYTELASVYDNVILGTKVAGFEVDVYMPEDRIGIEIDGFPWHTSRVEADIRKSKKLTREGVRLIRLRDTRLKPLDDDTVPFLASINKDVINRLVERIGLDREKEQAYIVEEEFRNERLFRELAVQRNRIDKKDSLAFKHPQIAREWDYTKNAPILPSQIEAQSNTKMWWVCPVCGKSYSSRISHRTYMGSGCPYCSGTKVAPDTSFAALHPEALKDWDWEANTVDPYSLSPRSNVICQWKCEHGHTYATSPNKKVAALRKWGKYSGCRKCYRQRGKKAA